MRIAAIERRRWELPLRASMRVGSANERSRVGLSIRVITATGDAGDGEATALPSFGTESLPEAESALSAVAPAMVGRRVPERLEELDAWLTGLQALARAPTARHGLELALLDLMAAGQRQSVAQLLAGELAVRTVQVNALLSAAQPRVLAEEAERLVRQGYRTLKIKVAAQPIEVDARRLFAVRRAVGPDVALRIDANGGWSELEARTALRGLEPLRLELCEQPVPPWNVDALRRLRPQVRCPLAADESIGLVSEDEWFDPDKARAADVLVLKPMVLGGLLRAERLARRARKAGVGVVVTTSLDGPIALAGACQLAAALGEPGRAHGLATGGLFAAGGHETYAVSAGQIALPCRVGLGLSAC